MFKSKKRISTWKDLQSKTVTKNPIFQKGNYLAQLKKK